MDEIPQLDRGGSCSGWGRECLHYNGQPTTIMSVFKLPYTDKECSILSIHTALLTFRPQDEYISYIGYIFQRGHTISYLTTSKNSFEGSGRLGRDRMVVGLTTTCAIRAYHY
jgi:hypothetical protein